LPPRTRSGQLAEINRTQAVIEFTPDGTCLTANENFCKACGLPASEEVKGSPHSLFVEPHHRDSAEYRQFWRELGEGKFQTGEYRRVGKGGKEVWIQATYTRMVDVNGHVDRVVKFATDITPRKVAEASLPHHDCRGEPEFPGNCLAPPRS
jgi:methyl-accepting chemotaxis protein